MHTADIRHRWLDLLRRPRSHRRALGLARQRRPDAALHGRRHGAVRPVPHRPRARAVPARDERAEVRAHPRHRGGRQDAAARHVLPDERQLLVRRLLQGEARSATPGSCSPTSESDGGFGFDREGPLGHRLQGRRRGGRPSGSRSAGLPDERIQRLDKDTTTGRPVSPARPARARRSSSTAARSTAPTGGPRPTTTATSRSGTSSSCSTCAATAAARDFEILGELPQEEHRHRHGPRARRLPQAGRREHVRDRPGAPGARPGRRSSSGRRYGARPRRRRAHARRSPTTCARASCS